MNDLSAALPTYADVHDAARLLAGKAHRTPVLTSRTLDTSTGATVFLKCENLQRGGAFKFRGAYNALARLDESARRRGVVAFSSGNHAQAVALAGRMLDIPAVIVMPTDAPQVKIDGTRGYGAEVVLYDRTRDNREDIARELQAQRRLTLVPPFDHSHILAGQGTAAKELVEDVGPLDLLLVPCGGGGLLSGSALAAHALSPGVAVIGVEPEAGDDVLRSFRTGVIQHVDNPQTIADGARTAAPGAITFPLIQRFVSDMTAVDDGALLRSTWFLWERMKIIVEPTGALGVAALMERKIEAPGKRVGIILSGGNADVRALCALR